MTHYDSPGKASVHFVRRPYPHQTLVLEKVSIDGLHLGHLSIFEAIVAKSGDPHRTTMMPRICASKSKKEFFQHLGLNDTDERDRRLYRDMMDEAAVARERLCSNPFNLTPQHRANPNLSPPYSSAMFMESAIFEEVRNIYASASHHTKYLYNKGIFMEGPNVDNWVIRWCLWHVFRYRDDRNRNRSHRGSYYPVVSDCSEDGERSESNMGTTPCLPREATAKFGFTNFQQEHQEFTIRSETHIDIN